MSDIRLFDISGVECTELVAASMRLERSLQTEIERNLESMLGVRFLASEYTTSKLHGGRMDTLGLDENGCPVIIEYKRDTNENVINQGLFYLDWLLDHRGTFELLVQKTLGPHAAEKIDWSSPRLLCIAGGFTRYDEHAVQQIDRNIELIRYRQYGKQLLLFELVNAATASPLITTPTGAKSPNASKQKTVTESLAAASPELQSVFDGLRAFLEALGDDVHMHTLKYYFAFRRMKNFACEEVRPQVSNLLIYAKLNPDQVALVPGFTRDVRKIGHMGPGDLEITISCEEDLEKAKELLTDSYNVS